MIKNAFFLSIVLVISACTSNDLYKSFQADGSTCRKLPEPQREECAKQVDSQMTYDEYKKERQKL